ncbi:MAG: UDP-N-acetylmuramoyl-L-alanine--D-glutamate ligase [Deltaproteobacteria bacterium]|nr:UDP-N-acetylmuramoyl-L-alanine--D-glutamate ligase [Deltaproteobacteria bacterium]
MDVGRKRIFILGAARSGIAAALLAKSMGASVFVSDIKEEDKLGDAINILRRNGIDYETGMNSLEKIREYDLLVLSPGVFLAEDVRNDLKSRNIPIISELEFAFKFIDIPIIAVTGTNGKSTTTALIGHILGSSGISVFVGGNIGNALSNLPLDKRRYDVAVVEVSSFMLEDIDEFKPFITVFTNISPDHLDRYKDYQKYVNAKLNIFKNLDSNSCVVVNKDCKDLKVATENFNVRKIYFSRLDRKAELFATQEGTNFRVFVNINDHNTSLIFKNKNLVGVHNLENVLAAVGAAVLYGVKYDSIESAINIFGGLEHRIEFVAEINGVRFFNDSKATNVESTMVALNSFENNIIWIAGGRHKGSPYTGLAELVRTRVKRIIAIGEAAPLIRDDLGFVVDVELFGRDFDSAIRRSFEIAEHGDVVLFSPACSSFDMFNDYEERGRYFKRLVKEIGYGYKY